MSSNGCLSLIFTVKNWKVFRNKWEWMWYLIWGWFDLIIISFLERLIVQIKHVYVSVLWSFIFQETCRVAILKLLPFSLLVTQFVQKIKNFVMKCTKTFPILLRHLIYETSHSFFQEVLWTETGIAV